MSDSRLEKFIYAICSMDVSDLPVPLSRIEKLWNCLITGETPDFEPLSRNEKYLMAMLDRYDISNLPAPMSRGEKLLYKIAVGETDLSDVPDYLSRYEELLKYLIENGGISEGDFEYVLYTLNQSLSTLYSTAEKPVKSAILSGQTLVNALTTTSLSETSKGTEFTAPLFLPVKQIIKPNTKYLLKYNIIKNTLTTGYFVLCNNEMNNFCEDSVTITPNELGKKSVIIRTKETLPTDYCQRCYIHQPLEPVEGEIIEVSNMMLIEYQDGMENWDIPYFEGMKSVQMPVLTTTTGKNLFDKTKIILDRLIDNHTGIISTDTATNTTDFIKVIPNTQYTMSFNFETPAWTRCFGLTEPKDGKYVTDANGISDKCYFDSGSKTFTFTTSPTTNYLIFSFGKGVEETFQLEQGPTATTYEPYKLISCKMPVLKTIGENIIGECINPTEKNKQYKAYLKPNTDYTLSYKNTDGSTTGSGKVYLKNGDTQIANYGYKHQMNFTTPSTTNSETILCINSRVSGISVLLIEGKVPYTGLDLETILKKPYKSNILTVNEDVTLRGIGEGSNRVEDELNCLTGEVTERIGEVVLDGSEGWVLQTNSTDVRGTIYRTSITDIDTTINNSHINCVCDKVKVESWTNVYRTLTDKTFATLSNQQLRVQFNGTLEELKTWLSEVQPTVQYLKTESVKTVDLTTVDQDGQPTELGTFENVTYVSLEAENLIPEVEMEVETIISEELASASPLMDDISTKQQQLETTVDEQSENVDATMIATTEIYEEIL